MTPVQEKERAGLSEEGVANVPVDDDIRIHFGRGSRYELEDPEDEPTECSHFNVKITKMHDGSCGFMQWKQLHSARSRENWKDGILDLLNQIDHAASNARLRSV